MKVGLFFGSFNPIHTGHLIIAHVMIETTDIDKVWFIVSPQNPFKTSHSLLHEFDRLDLVRAAIDDNYNMEAKDVEFHMPRPSYTVNTLAYLSDRFPQKKFVLIIGEDNLKQFPKWKNHQTILNDYGLYVYPRPGAEKSEIAVHQNITKVEAPLLNISATFIRSCVKKGYSIRYMVPEAVEETIRAKKFYL